MFRWLLNKIKENKFVKSRSLRRKAKQEFNKRKREKLFRRADRLEFQSKRKNYPILKRKNYYINNGFVKSSKDKNFNTNLNFKI